MRLDRVDVVLVRPARAANVAAACRALKNMGMRSVALVGRDPGPEDRAARSLAYGAWDVLDGIRPYGTLRAAVEGCTLVAGTSGRPHAEAWTARRLAEEASGRAGDGRLAVVFGPEAEGLRNDELALCHVRVHIPTEPAQHSLNLAQAVLLVAYDLRLAALAEAGARWDPPAPRAAAGVAEAALDDLREALLAIGYLNPSNPEAILAEIRGLLSRAGLTPREATLLRGLARQILWSARRVAPGTDGSA
ncbi:MAG TPA: TrmH family RNA methyltransferase [Vicinamibacteria bacterium]|nr:TrmH family RNA methyltransferase [Vicinamibacteria bacterium]